MVWKSHRPVHLEEKIYIVVSQSSFHGKPAPGNAQRSQSKIKLKLHKKFKQVKLIEANKK